jgi:hypothetical protein
MGAADLFAVALQRRLHGQGRVAGPQGVILMRQRGAKEGHNAITQHLVHRALVAMYGLHHVVQSRIEELPGRFWIEVRNQLSGAFEVGNSTVTCLRSPSRTLRDVKIFSARYEGV